MRKLIAFGTATALLLPVLTFAAFDDVSLTTDTVLSVNDITINVPGSTAVVDSITVSATTISFTLASGASIELTAPSRNVLAVSTETDGTITCTSAQSKILYGRGLNITVTRQWAL